MAKKEVKESGRPGDQFSYRFITAEDLQDWNDTVKALNCGTWSEAFRALRRFYAENTKKAD